MGGGLLVGQSKGACAEMSLEGRSQLLVRSDVKSARGDSEPPGPALHLYPAVLQCAAGQQRTVGEQQPEHDVARVRLAEANQIVPPASVIQLDHRFLSLLRLFGLAALVALHDRPVTAVPGRTVLLDDMGQFMG